MLMLVKLYLIFCVIPFFCGLLLLVFMLVYLSKGKKIPPWKTEQPKNTRALRGYARSMGYETRRPRWLSRIASPHGTTSTSTSPSAQSSAPGSTTT